MSAESSAELIALMEKLRVAKESAYFATLYHLGFYPGNRDVAEAVSGVLTEKQIEFLRALSRETYAGLKDTKKIYESGVIDGIRTVFVSFGFNGLPDRDGNPISFVPDWAMKEINFIAGGTKINIESVGLKLQ